MISLESNLLAAVLRKMKLLSKTNHHNKMLRRKQNLRRNERSVRMLMKKSKTLKPLSQVLIMASRPWRPTMAETKTIMSLQLISSLKKKRLNWLIKVPSRRSRSPLRWISSISTLMWMRRQRLKHNLLRKAKQSDERKRKTNNLL